eukprot:751782-Hanusia_phi.AAC.2
MRRMRLSMRGTSTALGRYTSFMSPLPSWPSPPLSQERVRSDSSQSLVHLSPREHPPVASYSRRVKETGSDGRDRIS